MFSAIQELRPHIGHIAIAGLITVLAISQLDPSYDLALYYETLIQCFGDLVRIVNDIIEDIVEYTYESDSDDSPFNDSEF